MSEISEPVTGSSPHTRGLLSKAALVRAILRIIPAHAGFTAPQHWKWRLT